MAWGIHAFDEQTGNDNTVSDGLQDAFYGFGTIGEYRVLAQTDDCIVIRLENETGEGDMIIYRVFDGVFLIYNDFQFLAYQNYSCHSSRKSFLHILQFPLLQLPVYFLNL